MQAREKILEGRNHFHMCLGLLAIADFLMGLSVQSFGDLGPTGIGDPNPAALGFSLKRK